jgi:hypothetical protein
VPEAPSLSGVPAVSLASEKRIPSLPPTSVMEPEMVTVPFGPRVRFPGVSGCRNPGVTVSRAESAGGFASGGSSCQYRAYRHGDGVRVR